MRGNFNMPPLHLLIKPASGACNLRCRYCFYYDLTQKRETACYGMMTPNTLEQIIQKALDYADDDLTIAYQGGEPTLVGLDFYRESIRFQNQYNHKHLRIHNAIQTNGFALDEEWAKFFAEHHFLVGVSVDGTSKTHDAFRLDPKGKDSFSKVMKNIRLLEKYHVDFNILTVVHAFTAKNIQEIYRFYKAKHFQYLQFIPCLDPMGEEPGKEIYSLTPKAYGEFLCKLFDLWYDDLLHGNEVHIRQFENYVEMLLGYPPESCGMSGICSFQHVIEADGTVYPCDFYVMDGYELGNLTACSFDDIQKRRQEIQFIEESTVIDPKCRDCAYYSICRGGCKRYREPRLDGKLRLNCFCESYQLFFSYAGSRLVQLSKRLGARF